MDISSLLRRTFCFLFEGNDLYLVSPQPHAKDEEWLQVEGLNHKALSQPSTPLAWKERFTLANAKTDWLSEELIFQAQSQVQGEKRALTFTSVESHRNYDPEVNM